MPKYIYPSERVLPYVYYGVHRITGQFYFGSRGSKSQKLPSHLDLGTHYFTSSKYVKELGFENFVWIILAEFFDARDAYIFEQLCIKNEWNNDLKLNYMFTDPNKGKCWSVLGLKFPNRTKPKEDHISKGTKLSEERRLQISQLTSGENNPMFGKKHSPEAIEKNRLSNTGRIPSIESRLKMSISGKGKKRAPRQNIQCPYCNKVGDPSNMIRWHFDKCKLKL
jgi:hypothetical protein